MCVTLELQSLLQLEVMSSETRVESCSEGQGEDARLERKQDEETDREEVEVPCEENHPTESLRQEESSSLDHSDTYVVTSEGGVEEETKESRARGSGVCSVERHVRRSLPRGLSTCSFPGKDRERQAEEPRGPGPFYYFGGTNGAEIVSSYCESRGWKRIHNKHREDFKLKWCETKSSANYCNFREGEQLVYQVPNNKVLTTKIGLLSSLREYERVSSKVNHGRGLRRLKMEEFMPTTFRMDVREERDAFFAQQEGVRNNEGRMWICKPTGLNQGRGIFLLKSQEELTAFRLKLQHLEESQAHRRMRHCRPQARIVQQYIQSPLLLKGKKFDVRSYLLIACTAPYMVFFRHGYVRLTCDLYDPSSNNLSAHLTNQYMQKKNPLYSQLKEDTVWSMENFNTYVNDRFRVAKGLPRDWVLGAFARRMQQIMKQCFFAVKSKLDRRLGLFDLIGCDFMVDEGFKVGEAARERLNGGQRSTRVSERRPLCWSSQVWLLEMNCNPALHTNCKVLKEVIPSTVVETMDLTLEIFNKCRLRQRILPLSGQREFVLLYSGASPPGSEPTCNKRKTTKKTQKTEARRCKSGVEGKNASPASPGNVSGSGEGRGSSKSGLHRSASTATSPLFQNSSSVQRPSHSDSSLQTVRSKTPGPRVHLKLTTCTLRHHPKAADDPKLLTLALETRPFPPCARTPVREDGREGGEEAASAGSLCGSECKSPN
ncbi:protein polyglycylase TTLL10 isoform X2 [Seriola aureovittata]|uniref:protein polyglycylase TTLL10 isoform X2 n=1 Tax=Seriola aureovittata TaxID=2871759 RepID=UPI0024BE8505|nr:protein polyglycylase TTLL10 isoform X2 [Seriola aureovittata]